MQTNTKTQFVPGQRWVSDSEPELGLGIVLEAGVREVKIAFHAADTVRVYAYRNAPLRRARLEPGDRARSRTGRVFLVRAVRENGGLLTYVGEGTGQVSEVLPEQELLDRMTFSDPDKRLLAGQVGRPRDFALRYRTHLLRRNMLGSPARGLAGARVELLEHQISIAHEVASRHNAKVLLADEVGLGKTIEAGLIFHRLYVTGQITRVLIVTPPQLAHQWLVELYRRFNHMFTVMDEDLCRSEEKGDPSVNPFLNRQTMICAIDFLAGSARRVGQAAEAGIDLLIVDEAHHLLWSPGSASPEYEAVDALSRVSARMALLTATPVQLGQSGHFGRLRLLDPERFSVYADYLEETAHYQELAGVADLILSSDSPAPSVAASLAKAFPEDKALQARAAEYAGDVPGSRQTLIEDLVDRHGTGRMMFRNRRLALGGFPRRLIYAAPLDNTPERREFVRALSAASGNGAIFPPTPTGLARFLNGPAAYVSGDLKGAGDATELLARAWRRDPRLDWLVDLLKETGGEKILLICSHKAVVFALQEILPTLTTAAFAAFHENLSMATRDKNAAYFAQPGGARLLLCSEIGSEGRNFQFAHRLVLFDLPVDPSVLEQRIGRLDRIGQKSDIHVYVPYVRGTVHEVLYRWYAEGMDAFRHPVLGSDYFLEEQLGRILETCRLAAALEADRSSPPADGAHKSSPPHGDDQSPERISSLDEALRATLSADLSTLVADTQTLAVKIRETLEKGRDRLLELNSNRPELARGLIAEIGHEDRNPALEEYLEEVFDHFGVDSQSTEAKRGYFLFPGDRMEVDSFPELPASGLAVTYDRAEALVREDLAFLTMDHPLVRGAVDMVLAEGEGTAGFVVWRNAPLRGFALEAVFILEAAAPGYLHIDRLLAPTPIRILVDQAGEDISRLLPLLDTGAPEPASTDMLEENHAQFEKLVAGLLESAARHAALRQAGLQKGAREEAERRLGYERERLRALQPINPSVTEGEVEAADRLLQETLEQLHAASLRLDALQLVQMGTASAALTSIAPTPTRRRIA